jgi:hypothetical protein
MVTPQACGQRRRTAQGITSLIFYIKSLDRLTSEQKDILLFVADCHCRGSPFHPTLPELAKLCSCSRKTAWRALQGLDGRHGWIIRDWRGGQKSNRYLPGWRLRLIVERWRIELWEQRVWNHKLRS